MTRSIYDHLDNSPVPSPTSWPSRRPRSPATQAAYAALEAQAARTTEASIEARAQYFAADPTRLDLIGAGLFGLFLCAPRIAKERVDALIEVELKMRRRFGGEVSLINLKGAARFLERQLADGGRYDAAL